MKRIKICKKVPENISFYSIYWWNDYFMKFYPQSEKEALYLSEYKWRGNSKVTVKDFLNEFMSMGPSTCACCRYEFSAAHYKVCEMSLKKSRCPLYQNRGCCNGLYSDFIQYYSDHVRSAYKEIHQNIICKANDIAEYIYSVRIRLKGETI